MFVSNVDPDFSDQNLAGIFKDSNFKVQKCKLLYDNATGKSKCAGFVEFQSTSEAAEAVK